jgi:hypothetical protein
VERCEQNRPKGARRSRLDPARSTRQWSLLRLSSDFGPTRQTHTGSTVHVAPLSVVYLATYTVWDGKTCYEC